MMKLLTTTAALLALTAVASADAHLDEVDTIAKIASYDRVCQSMSEAATRGLRLLARESGVTLGDTSSSDHKLLVLLAAKYALYFEQHPEETRGFCATVEEKVLPDLERKGR